LGIEGLSISVNSLGNQETRQAYREALLSYLRPLADRMSPHARERFEQNPLRVLDSKDERDRELTQEAPRILDLLTADDRQHWEGLLKALDALGTPYAVDPALVRGLDYYTRTTFEISAESGQLGTQNALLGGGRYDDMLEALGGPSTPAIGFAMGLERILLAMPEAEPERGDSVVFAPLGEPALLQALVLARELRKAGVTSEVDGRGASMKSMLRRANASGARLCVVIGETEVDRRVVQLKDLAEHQQTEIEQGALSTHVQRILEPVSEAKA
jgi:histidyl-tRNA synthetase